jgi:hypothetical protein
MSAAELPALPSPGLRDALRQSVETRFSDLSSTHRNIVLDGLGDLALILARRPLRTWFGTRDELARLLEHRWVWPEATAVIDLAIDRQLLVPTIIPDEYRPVDRAHFVWLGARRIARTEDQDGLMDYRMNGALFEMFALAPALMDDPSAAAGVVAVMAHSPGPFEDLLELAPALAAMSVAWGAESSPELRMFLTERALAWTQPMGADWNRDIGTALLSLECQRHEERDQLLHIASEILQELVHNALSEPSLADQPTILATLDTVLAMVSAGASRQLDSRSVAMPAQFRDNIELLIQALPAAQAHCVGRTVGRLLPPGPLRNEALVHAFQKALEHHSANATVALTRLTAPYDDVAPTLAHHLALPLERPDDPTTTAVALAICDILASFDSCPAALIAPLVSLLADPLDPELRISAAAALGRHVPAVLVDPRVSLLETRLMRGDLPAELMAAEVACLLHLRSADPRLGPAALALLADELPQRLKPRLAAAVDLGLRSHPLHLTELLGLYGVLPDRVELNDALLAVASAVHDSEQRIHELGPFQTLRPLHPDLRKRLVDALIPLANRSDDALLVAEASALYAGLLPHDREVAQVLISRRAASAEPQIKGIYDLALGLTRLFIPEVVERLGRDAARGDENVAAAACVALRLHVETFAQASVLEPWLPEIRSRVDDNGDQDVQALQLLAQLSTLPLGA